MTYTYDNNGNTLTKTDASGTTTFTWDYENRLVGVSLPGDGTIEVSHSPFGTRVHKRFNGASTVFVYDGNELVEETNAMGTAQARYTYGPRIDEPLSINSHFFLQDGLGSVTSLADGSGGNAATFVYDSFGGPLNFSGVDSRMRYTAREWDTEVGIYYYRARYFDPASGRFVTEDPIGFKAGDVNFYSYVYNNPVRYTDPSGLQSADLKNEHLVSGTKYVPCPDCLTKTFGPMIKPIMNSKGGCFLRCSVIQFWDDITIALAGLSKKTVRDFLRRPKVLKVVKGAGVCGTVIASGYCAWDCELLQQEPKPGDPIGGWGLGYRFGE